MVWWLFISDGDHEPEIPFVEVSAKSETDSPKQIEETSLKVGVIIGFTSTVIVDVLAHKPIEGVKVYVVVAVLSNAGDHVPIIPFSEVEGNVNEPPSHIEETCSKVGVIIGFTTTVISVEFAQIPVEGVNVYVVVE